MFRSMRVPLWDRMYGLLLGLLIATTVTALVFSVLIRSTVFENFIFDRAQLPKISERKAVQQAVHAYLDTHSALPQDLFTEREVLHMKDVYALVNSLRVYAGTTLVVLVLIFYCSSLSLFQWRIIIHRTMFLFLSIGIPFALFMAMYFERFFIWFHEVFFSNDLWLLDPTKHALIRAYPPEFFESFVGYSVLILFFVAALLFIITHNSWHRSKSVLF